MLEVECDINCLFIYYQVYVLIYSTTTVLLAFERVGFESDSQKTIFY